MHLLQLVNLISMLSELFPSVLREVRKERLLLQCRFTPERAAARSQHDGPDGWMLVTVQSDLSMVYGCPSLRLIQRPPHFQKNQYVLAFVSSQPRQRKREGRHEGAEHEQDAGTCMDHGVNIKADRRCQSRAEKKSTRRTTRGGVSDGIAEYARGRGSDREGGGSSSCSDVESDDGKASASVQSKVKPGVSEARRYNKAESHRQTYDEDSHVGLLAGTDTDADGDGYEDANVLRTLPVASGGPRSSARLQFESEFELGGTVGKRQPQGVGHLGLD